MFREILDDSGLNDKNEHYVFTKLGSWLTLFISAEGCGETGLVSICQLAWLPAAYFYLVLLPFPWRIFCVRVSQRLLCFLPSAPAWWCSVTFEGCRPTSLLPPA